MNSGLKRTADGLSMRCAFSLAHVRPCAARLSSADFTTLAKTMAASDPFTFRSSHASVRVRPSVFNCFIAGEERERVECLMTIRLHKRRGRAYPRMSICLSGRRISVSPCLRVCTPTDKPTGRHNNFEQIAFRMASSFNCLYRAEFLVLAGLKC